MKNKIYEARVFKSKTSKKWYVYIYNLDTQKIVKKIYKGFEFIESDYERHIACDFVQKELQKELDAGWIPKASRNALPSSYSRLIKINDAYKAALDILMNSDRKQKTKSSYKTHYKEFTKAVRNLNWQSNLFCELEQLHITMILEKISEGKNAGNYNKHLALCKSYFRTLKQNFIIKDNHALGLPERKYTPKQREIITNEQQTQIVNHFKIVCPAFNVFLKTLYHLAIRPEELRHIKCGMINTDHWYFNLPPEITKNGKNGIVLIPEDLKADLMQLDLSNPEWYLFGIQKVRSRSRKGIFTPSPNKVSINAANNLWRKEVKQNLNIPCDMYSLKYKSSNDKRKNGIPLEIVKEINRQSTTDITKIYATENAIITQKEFIDKFGTFK